MNDAINTPEPAARELAAAAGAHVEMMETRAKLAAVIERRTETFRAAVAAGATQKRLAEYVGVSAGRVGQIIGGAA